MSKELQCETLLLLLDTLCERFEQFRSADKPACESVDSLVAAGGSLSYTPSVDGPATAAAAEDAADTPHRGAVRMKAMLKTAFLRLEPHERQRGHRHGRLMRCWKTHRRRRDMGCFRAHDVRRAGVGLPPAVNGAPGKQLVGALYEVYLEAKVGDGQRAGGRVGSVERHLCAADGRNRAVVSQIGGEDGRRRGYWRVDACAPRGATRLFSVFSFHILISISFSSCTKTITTRCTLAAAVSCHIFSRRHELHSLFRALRHPHRPLSTLVPVFRPGLVSETRTAR